MMEKKLIPFKDVAIGQYLRFPKQPFKTIYKRVETIETPSGQRTLTRMDGDEERNSYVDADCGVLVEIVDAPVLENEFIRPEKPIETRETY
jgi:hypothetical protein